MAMLCPECRLPLVVVGENRAQCTAHPATFDILFTREITVQPALAPRAVSGEAIPAATALPSDAVSCRCPQCGARNSAGAAFCARCGLGLSPTQSTSAATAASGAASQCAHHAGVDATRACKRCHALICDTCAFRQADGSFLCPTCASAPGGPVASPPMTVPWAIAQDATALADGSMCVCHPDVPAICRCKQCNAAVCATCDFTFPGGLHLCPTCATTPATGLSGKRRSTVIWSIVLAVWSTLLTALMLSGALEDVASEEAAASVLGTLVLIPLLIGFGLGVASFERRMKSPPIVWVAAIWNGLLVGVWLLLIVVGLMIG